MATFLFLFSLILLSLSSFAFASPRTSFFNAAEILSDSGYLSMALTLQTTFNTLNLESKAVTIFAPSDLAFVQQGQLSLLALQYHISPIKLSIESFKNLSIDTKIPTLLLNHSLTVTSLDFNGQLSVNDVLIQESPIFDDGFLVIYGIDNFFNSSYEISTVSAPEPSPSSTSWISNASQRARGSYGFNVNPFGQASNLLMSRGYTIMATFLDMQLMGFTCDTRLTIFAPVDEAMEAYVGNVSDYSMLFRRHVVPRSLSLTDLVRLDDGTMLPTFSKGFIMINKTRSGDAVLLNDVPVILPNMYHSNWIVVHGLNQLLMSPAKQEIIGDSFSELNGDDVQNPPDYSEYGTP